MEKCIKVNKKSIIQSVWKVQPKNPPAISVLPYLFLSFALAYNYVHQVLLIRLTIFSFSLLAGQKLSPMQSIFLQANSPFFVAAFVHPQLHSSIFLIIFGYSFFFTSPVSWRRQQLHTSLPIPLQLFSPAFRVHTIFLP